MNFIHPQFLSPWARTVLLATQWNLQVLIPIGKKFNLATLWSWLEVAASNSWHQGFHPWQLLDITMLYNHLQNNFLQANMTQVCCQKLIFWQQKANCYCFDLNHFSRSWWAVLQRLCSVAACWALTLTGPLIGDQNMRALLLRSGLSVCLFVTKKYQIAKDGVKTKGPPARSWAP